MAGKAGFNTVETSEAELEELEKKIKEHRRSTVRRVIAVIILLLVIIAFVEIWFALRTYDSYEVKNTIEQGDMSASHFADYKDLILEYSNDGIVCMDGAGELIWNQAFEMSAPELDICEDYIAAFDKGGKDIYIMSETGLVKRIETSMLIKTVCIANQGTVAVMMEENNNFYVKLFDKAGKELTSGEFFSEKGTIPVDIAISDNAQKLAVDLVDITGGQVNSQIAFYNFGSVGQNEIDNNVGTFTYEDTFIAEIEYVNNNVMLAKSDSAIMIYEGSQKPELAREIKFEQTIESVANSNKYIAIIYSNQDEEATHHIQIYNLSGKLIMESDTNFAYTDIHFLANNELLIKDMYKCQIFTIHSIKKFDYSFDVPLYNMMYDNGSANYIIFREGAMEEVRLK